MKVIKKEQASEYTNGPNCSGYEFDLGDKNLDGAFVSVAGRFPENGRVVNEECREIAYVLEGNGKIVINDQEFEIASGSLIVIEKGEKFFWAGDFKLFVYCSPAWFPEQHKTVE
jgi:mannose-6-phosphate isomerase-like protein (cupin superfamily)